MADLAVFLLCGELVDYKVSRDHTCEKQGGVTVETLRSDMGANSYDRPKTAVLPTAQNTTGAPVTARWFCPNNSATAAEQGSFSRPGKMVGGWNEMLADTG